jgi:cold shock CspA family protein
LKGKISKLANLHGSTWGRIQPEGSGREIFFNVSSLDKNDDYHSLVVGQEVDFEEEPDRANGMHAFNVRLIAPTPSA